MCRNLLQSDPRSGISLASPCPTHISLEATCGEIKNNISDEYPEKVRALQDLSKQGERKTK